MGSYGKKKRKEKNLAQVRKNQVEGKIVFALN